MGCVRTEGVASPLAKESLAALLNTCLILYTQSSTQKTEIIEGGGLLPAGGIFLPVVPQGDSFQEAQ
jgi:hypothetical protein